MALTEEDIVHVVRSLSDWQDVSKLIYLCPDGEKKRFIPVYSSGLKFSIEKFHELFLHKNLNL